MTNDGTYRPWFSAGGAQVVQPEFERGNRGCSQFGYGPTMEAVYFRCMFEDALITTAYYDVRPHVIALAKAPLDRDAFRRFSPRYVLF